MRASSENIFTIIMLSALFDNCFPHVFLFLCNTRKVCYNVLYLEVNCRGGCFSARQFRCLHLKRRFFGYIVVYGFCRAAR